MTFETDQGKLRAPLDAKRIEAEFLRRAGIRVRGGVVGARRTTIFIGGAFEFFVEPATIDELCTTIQVLRSMGERYRILGAGSNVLIADEGLAGWTLYLPKEFRFLEQLGPTEFRVGGATSLMWLAREVGDRGYAGLEFAGGIPGSFGGGVRMNAGAHGYQLSDLLREVTLVQPDGQLETVSAASLRFSYRHAEIAEGAVVVAGVLSLTEGDRTELMQKRRELLAERKLKQPLTAPSAGSVFKNPDTGPAAGSLIERCGLKGCAIGGAVVSPLHANWILNESRTATFDHVARLMTVCQDEVRGRTGVVLRPELVVWGTRGDRNFEAI